MNGTDPCPRCGDDMKVHGTRTALRGCDFRDESDLTPDLIGFEGWRVEAVPVEKDEDGNTVEGATRRFYVGKSTGWKPCHLEVLRRDSSGGAPADKSYAMVTRLYQRTNYKLLTSRADYPRREA